MWKIILGFVIKYWTRIAIVGIVLTLATSFWVKLNQPTTDVTVQEGATYVSSAEGYSPGIGCATGRQFFGWAHKK